MEAKEYRQRLGLAGVELNNTNQEYFDDVVPRMPLGEPHFDEEATLLSAQPVVPLKEIKAEERLGKRLIFGLAMACSIMLGAVGATLVYKQRGQGQSAAISNQAPGTAEIPVEEPISSPETGEIIAGAASESFPKSSASNIEDKSTSSAATPSAREPKASKSLTEDADADERKATRAERIELRRLRRQSERQARREAGGRRKSSDDILRIRDIFEGPARP